MGEFLKICFFSQSLMPGGSEKQAVLTSRLLSKYYEVHFIIFYPDKVDLKLLNQLHNSNVKIKILKGNPVNKLIKLYRFFLKEKFDIVFNYLLLPNVLGGLFTRLTKTKHSIGGIRSAKIENNKIFLNKIAHNYLNHLTIFNNEAGTKYCSSRGFKMTKIKLIRNSLDTIPEEIKRENKKITTILSVGRFEKVKAYDIALDSIKKLTLKNKTFKYIIVGWGELESYLRKKIENEKLTDYVTLIINPDNLTDYYLKSDIFLQTSVYEGFSNTILEALSYSLPVVATNVGDNSYMIKHEINGYLCAVNSTEEIVNYLELLLNDFNQRIIFGKESYRIIKKEFSSVSLEKKYLQFIQQIQGKN